jgi:hypothetical protein
MVIKVLRRLRDILNLLLGYVILSIPALLVVLFFKRKSKKELENLDEIEYTSRD